MTARSHLLRSFLTIKDLAQSLKLYNFFLRIIKYIKDAGQDAWSDVSARWVHGLFAALIFGLATLLVVVSLYIHSPAVQSTSACRPNGGFSVYNDYNLWGIDDFFQINIPFGTLSFTQAKVIDTFWDLVVGRAGQSILTFLLWRSIASYMAAAIETKPTTYAIFFVLFLEDGPSLLSTYRLLRDFVSYRGIRSKLSTAQILLGIIFVLAWPTLISSMSGYTPLMDPYVQDIDGNLVPYKDFRFLNYIIHDGWRIGLDGNYPIPITTPINILLNQQNHATPDYTRMMRHEQQICGDSTAVANEGDNLDFLCRLRRDITEYAELFGLYGLNNTPSLWLNKTIPSPSLNIEAFYPCFYDYQTTSQDLFGDPMWAWTYANTTYYLQDIEMMGGCKPTAETFTWGFSFLQLFILIALLFIWSVGTYLPWAKAQSILPSPDQPEQRRGLKALLLLAETTRRELERHGIDPHSLTNKELKREIHKNLKGGSISFNLYLRDIKSSHHSLLRRFGRDLGWWVVIIASITLGVYYPAFFLLGGLVLVAFYVGSTTKSKLFLATFLVPISAISFVI